MVLGLADTGWARHRPPFPHCERTHGTIVSIFLPSQKNRFLQTGEGLAGDPEVSCCPCKASRSPFLRPHSFSPPLFFLQPTHTLPGPALANTKSDDFRGIWGMLVALRAASLALGAGEGSAPSYLTPVVASGLCDFPKSPVTLVLAHQPGGGGVQRVKVVDQECRKWHFMAFLKEKETETRGFQTLHRLSQLANPQQGVSRAHVCIQVSIWNAALGNSYA